MPGINTKQVELGRNNLAAVRNFFQTHLCATNRECSKVLGLSVEAVGRHVKTIRSEWKQQHDTRVKIISAAAKILKSKTASKEAKSAAASALTQRSRDGTGYVDQRPRRRERMR